MYGKASIRIPSSGNIRLSYCDGLSDRLAMTIGRRAAETLSDDDGFVTVVLESGRVVVIGLNMDVIRRCGGYREYANNVVGGPII